MNSFIKFKLHEEPYCIEVTNCPLYTEIEENGKLEKVFCQQTTEDCVYVTISSYLKEYGLKGAVHSIEVIENCNGVEGRLIATAENLRERGSLKLKVKN